ncbi:MAG: FIG000325: clustered with transcription termination protein NusA [uncultured Campylobacterales bacterium]|uniref:Ribosome maturation factor RimP n=1 Tax=uncultured Campylobacterales bacterium TaxID=352960 RepID=A0A6S6SIV9_9BACT|nr:MAG: FIG000325: clustered with transcription termination protein NusA [uncultured Campylobacterales bacterium]
MEKIEKIIQSFGAKLYDEALVKENGNNVYRVYIVSPNGVNLDLCAEITRAISPIIDLDPPMRGKYFLEVSSPGIERKLKNLKHFENSIGELVKITKEDKTKIKGKLLEVLGDTIKVETKEEIVEVSYNDINKAKTYYEW